VRQDALGGGGYVKWGGLDPSILVLRSTAAARAFVAAWRKVLLMASGLPLDGLVVASGWPLDGLLMAS
jgi:hypothetical protein